MTTKAVTVSAALRRAGFNPVSPATQREGLKAKQSGSRVRVVADLDSDNAARRMADDAADALSTRGYTVSSITGGAFYVSKN
jgi:hypothetical protein